MAAQSTAGRQFKLEDFRTVGSPLGGGAFGQVTKVMDMLTGDLYAMKTIRKQRVVEQGLYSYLEREVKTQIQLKHPDIIAMHFYFEDVEYVHLLLEFASGGSLFGLLRRSGRLQERKAAVYFMGIASALEHLHARGVIHRDLKPENILICEDGSAKLADFGWCADSSKDAGARTTFCGTWDYISPEMLDSLPHDHRVDVWAIGVLLYEMLTNTPPFRSSSQMKTVERIANVDLKFPDSFPPGASDLVSKLVVKEQDDRISLSLALEHDWLRRCESPTKRSHRRRSVPAMPTASIVVDAPERSERSEWSSSPWSALEPGDRSVDLEGMRLGGSAPHSAASLSPKRRAASFSSRGGAGPALCACGTMAMPGCENCWRCGSSQPTGSPNKPKRLTRRDRSNTTGFDEGAPGRRLAGMMPLESLESLDPLLDDASASSKSPSKLAKARNRQINSIQIRQLQEEAPAEAGPPPPASPLAAGLTDMDAEPQADADEVPTDREHRRRAYTEGVPGGGLPPKAKSVPEEELLDVDDIGPSSRTRSAPSMPRACLVPSMSQEGGAATNQKDLPVATAKFLGALQRKMAATRSNPEGVAARAIERRRASTGSGKEHGSKETTPDSCASSSPVVAFMPEHRLRATQSEGVQSLRRPKVSSDIISKTTRTGRTSATSEADTSYTSIGHTETEDTLTPSACSSAAAPAPQSKPRSPERVKVGPKTSIDNLFARPDLVQDAVEDGEEAVAASGSLRSQDSNTVCPDARLVPLPSSEGKDLAEEETLPQGFSDMLLDTVNNVSAGFMRAMSG